MLGVIILSMLAGVVLTLMVQYSIFQRWFGSLSSVAPPKKPQYEKFTLPKELQDVLLDPEIKNRKESCVALNFIFQFLFHELKDTKHVRRWMMRKMNVEFAEMLQTTTGKLLDQITVRDFTLGTTFPIIKNVTFENANLGEDGATFNELTLVLDLIYHGGFQLAVDVDLVFGKSAYLSVKVSHFKGQGRLQFHRTPYTHWSFTFLEDPVLDFDVESHFDGRQVPQITSLIVNQIRRSIRKKHTYPNYKIRYRPFFFKPEPKPPAQDIYYHGHKLSVGQLEVTVLDCSRLLKVGSDTTVYCTLAIDSVPWMQLMSSKRKLWVAQDIEIAKGQAQNIGLNFKEEFFHERYEDMVVVDTVVANTPAAMTDIKRNDVIVAVNGFKVTSSKQAAKLMKQGSDHIMVRIERSTPLRGASQQEFKFEEDTISIKDVDGEGSTGVADEDEGEDYINITVPPVENGSTTDKSSSRDRLSIVSSSSESRSTSSTPRKAFSILSTPSGLFHRKKARSESIASKEGSDFCAKFEKDEDGGKAELSASASPAERIRRRSRSDTVKSGKDVKEPTKIPTDHEKPEGTSSVGDLSFQMGMDDMEEDSIDLRKTKHCKATQDPVFNEKFDFELEDQHNYLNVCVWCNVPEKLDKQQRTIKPEKDILLGHMSIPLMDIALECLSTVQGDMQQSFQLTAPEIKANASRAKVSNLSAHSGFDERLCYGEITLAFVHQTQPLSNKERQRMQRLHHENEARQEKQLLENGGFTAPRRTTGRKHDFVGTSFQTSTYCNFCHKKIWLKIAFKCNVCGTICHKKCVEKCQAQALCTKGGSKKHKSHSVVSDTALTLGKKNGGKEEKEALLSRSFFGKFRRDSPKLPHKENGVDHKIPRRRSLSPEPSHERRRHNSAPNEENGLNVDPAASLLNVNSIPRTRSSTSLHDLVQENASPKIQPREIYDDDQAEDSDISSSTDSDDEMNLLRFFEKQKSAHNADEMVVTAAKEMGKELYAHLGPDQRREKLDAMVSKLQSEIDVESEHRAELARKERGAADQTLKEALRNKLHQSDEKIQSLALLMLHYCAGLQHCLDTMEDDKEVLLGNPEVMLGRAEGSVSSGEGSPRSQHSSSHSRTNSADMAIGLASSLPSSSHHRRANSCDSKDLARVRTESSNSSGNGTQLPTSTQTTGCIIKVTSEEDDLTELEHTLVNQPDSPSPASLLEQFSAQSESHSVLDAMNDL